MKKIKILIRGNVKGIFFRANIKERAVKLGLKGYVKNVDKGVEAVFIGEEEKVNEILEYCLKGPKGAKVKNVDIENFYEDVDNFEIRNN